MENLPYAAAEESKVCTVVDFPDSLKDESVDGYADFYRPNELAAMSDLLTFTMSHSCRSVERFQPGVKGPVIF
jgi:hypothetical protein